jgi:cbb3-type cytochrome oxidase subunit 3
VRGLLEAGFIFWGLFLVFGLVVVGYLGWMFWVEKRGNDHPPRHDDGP